MRRSNAVSAMPRIHWRPFAAVALAAAALIIVALQRTSSFALLLSAADAGGAELVAPQPPPAPKVEAPPVAVVARPPVPLSAEELGVAAAPPQSWESTATTTTTTTKSPSIYPEVRYDLPFSNVSQLDRTLWEPYLKQYLPDDNLQGCLEQCRHRNDKSRHKFLVPDEPACTNGVWCSSQYADAHTGHACNLICKNQYPADCAKANYYVLSHDHGAGIGSSLHQRLVALTKAINAGRVLVYNPRHQSLWTHPGDENAECASRRHGCYWLPITNCAVPDDYDAASGQYMVAPPSGYDEGLTPNSNPHGRHVNWWKAQLSQFLFRPNADMLARAVLPIAQRAFASHPRAASQLLPDRFISVFMRQGDKITESPLFSVEQYFARVLEQSKRHDIRDVFVGSDSQRAILGMINLTTADARFADLRVYVIHHQTAPGQTWIPYVRRWFGNLERDTIDNVWNKAPVREMINIAVSEWFIPQFASVWVGALSSNYCRFQDENRLGFGKHGVRYISLDGHQHIGR